MRDDEIRRQTEKDTTYKKAYHEWLDSLKPGERRRVESMGLAEAGIDYYGNMHEADVSDMQIADIPPESDTPPPATDHATMTASDALRRVICELIAQPNPGLSIDCLALALNLGDTPTETYIARKHRVTRAAVSKRCLIFIDIFDLPTPRYLKKKGSRKTYSKIQREHHAKNRKNIESFIARSRSRRGDTKQRD